VTVDELNRLDSGVVLKTLLECCGSREWGALMLQQRPFSDDTALLEAADRTWLRLGETDWLEAFAAHPRIGQKTDSEVSQREQAAALAAPDDVRARLAKLNADYEQRHGFIFIVFASGKTPEEILKLLESRINNDHTTEIIKAASEQMKITRLRLERLLGA
jgi:OHCU decarboxylase